MDAHERITAEARDTIRREITSVGGREVLFVGTVNEEGLVESVRAVARGDAGAVPAALRHAADADVVIHNHPTGEVVPSSADVDVAAELAARGIGSYIVDNDVGRLYAIVDPMGEETEEEPLDADSLAATIEPGGRAAKILPGYEPRDGQIEMLRLVTRAFNEQKHAACEAGTGVGKSFAYLIPALAWAEQNGERVVISTATINLQQQLLDNDIPTVQRILGTDLKAVLVKGRGNYLCPHRLQQALEEEENELFSGKNEELAAIREWADQTKTGSLSDLPFVPSDDVWSRVNSDADTCTPERCRKLDCPIVRARRAAASARILVSNHHLLFSDLALRVRGFGFQTTAVLPPFQRVVLDEAHTLERIATSHFSESMSRFAVLKQLRRLIRKRGKTIGGLVPKLSALVGDEPLTAEADALVSSVEQYAAALDQAALPLVESESAVRLLDLDPETRSASLLEPLRNLQTSLNELIERLMVAGRKLETDEEDDVYLDFRGIMRRLEGFAALCERFSRAQEEPEWVFWFERYRRPRREATVQLTTTPIEVAPLMEEALYRPLRSLVFSSATLTVQNSFRFWKRRIGLDRIELDEAKREPQSEPEEGDPEEGDPEEGDPEEGEPKEAPGALREKADGVAPGTGEPPVADATGTGRSLRKAPGGPPGGGGPPGAGEPRRGGGRLGGGERLLEGVFASPFDFARRVQLAVPVDAPPPNEPGYMEFLPDFLCKLLEISEGRALVLFTSYRMLEQVYDQVRPFLTARGITCMTQREDERSRLLDRFRSDTSSVLFATDSFWEGVDSPGRTLEVVVVCRLPFRVPGHPVQKTRLEALEARGGNSFMEMVIPDAVQKLKQGFGRLMRRTDDRGAVVVTDSRICSKHYGKVFLRSLPQTRQAFSSGDRILQVLEDFLYEERGRSDSLRDG